ncbi:hypothetical protein MRX96_003003 [Rhipicephalus microplus]
MGGSRGQARLSDKEEGAALMGACLRRHSRLSPSQSRFRDASATSMATSSVLAGSEVDIGSSVVRLKGTAAPVEMRLLVSAAT